MLHATEWAAEHLVTLLRASFHSRPCNFHIVNAPVTQRTAAGPRDCLGLLSMLLSCAAPVL